MSENSAKIKALASVYERRLAQSHLLDFARRVNPWFEAPVHLKYLAGHLERIESGAITRLAITAPPGHGKSSLTQAFVAWFIGRDPKRRVLALSGNQALARRNSRAVRGMLQNPAWPFECRLSGEALEEWETSEGGGVRAIGRDGQLTGFRAEAILFDDVQPDAGTLTSRQDDEAWYREISSTRLEPNGVQVLIATRWAEDDLIGRLREGASAMEWTFVDLPALARENDPLGRAEGDALWPERWPVDVLRKRKSEVGSLAFACQYQGAPVPPEGRFVQRAWFPRYTPGSLPAFKKIVLGVDCAAKAEKRNDNSAIAAVGVPASSVESYLLDVWAKRIEFPDLVRALKEHYARWKDLSVPVFVYVEDASAGTQLVQSLKRESGIPVILVKTGGKSKIERMESLTPHFEAGRVLLPAHASWLGAFEEELYAFPAARHDDRVDAFAIAIAQVAQKAFAYAGAFSSGASVVADGTGTVRTVLSPVSDGVPLGSGAAISHALRAGMF